MTAPTVRPAVACVTWIGTIGQTVVSDASDNGFKCLAIDNTSGGGIAARVREVVEAALCEWGVMGNLFSDDMLQDIADKVNARALGITTEARDGK